MTFQISGITFPGELVGPSVGPSLTLSDFHCVRVSGPPKRVTRAHMELTSLLSVGELKN